MPSIDLVDETYIAAAPQRVAAIVHDTQRWSEWFPEVTLAVFMDRDEKGIRWSASGDYVGSVELWVEPFGDGTILHHYLRLDPTVPGTDKEAQPWPDTLAGRRKGSKERVARANHWKAKAWALKDELEGDRKAGEPAV